MTRSQRRLRGTQNRRLQRPRRKSSSRLTLPVLGLRGNRYGDSRRWSGTPSGDATSQITFTLPSDGTYIVQVKAEDGTSDDHHDADQKEHAETRADLSKRLENWLNDHTR